MDDCIPLAAAISNLRAELVRAMEDGANQVVRFRLKPIELELNLAISHDAEAKGGVKFWVIDAGASGKYSNAMTQKLKLTLEAFGADGEFLVSSTGVTRQG